jgi:very-short-patch-repair endonuclease
MYMQFYIPKSIAVDVQFDSGKVDSFDKLKELLENKEKIQNKIAEELANQLKIKADVKLYSSKEKYKDAVSVDKGIVSLDTSDFVVNMVENGQESYDMKCIVNPLTHIYTSKGNKYIKDIEINDLVLTHTGKFKKVVNFFKEENKDDFFFKLTLANNRKIKSLMVTKNHPILTNKGWIKAEEIYLNKSDFKIISSAEPCITCQKLVCCKPNIQRVFCSKTCAAKNNNIRRKLEGRYDLTEDGKKRIGKKVTETNKRLASLGLHASQEGNTLHIKIKKAVESGEGWGFGTLTDEKLQLIQYKAAKCLGEKSRFSDPESKMWFYLKDLGFIRQYKFVRDEIKIYKNFKNRNKLWFFDFAHEKLKICIEVNGEQWHTKEQDDLRKIEVESKGWTYISFWSKEIYKDIIKCIDEVKRIMKNHNDNYQFIENDFCIEKISLINRSKLSRTFNYKYNLTVEEDSSYIANNIVTHNSGMLASNKTKLMKDGTKYLVVPLSKTTRGRHSWRDQSTGRFDKGSNIGGDVEFRIVSEKSRPDSWIHPGYEGLNLIEETINQSDDIIEAFLDDQIDFILNDI